MNKVTKPWKSTPLSLLAALTTLISGFVSGLMLFALFSTNPDVAIIQSYIGMGISALFFLFLGLTLLHGWITYGLQHGSKKALITFLVILIISFISSIYDDGLVMAYIIIHLVLLTLGGLCLKEPYFQKRIKDEMNTELKEEN